MNAREEGKPGQDADTKNLSSHPCADSLIVARKLRPINRKPYAAAMAAALLVVVASLAFAYGLDKQNIDNPALQGELQQAKHLHDRIATLQEEYDKEVSRLEAAKKSIGAMGSGIDRRFDWQLLLQYINLALPKPEKNIDAKRKLRIPDREFQLRNAKILSIEGVNSLYADDLPAYLKTVHQWSERLPGMSDVEQRAVWDYAKAANEEEAAEARRALPSQGWVVEIRGYTYYWGGSEFVENTLLRNLTRVDKGNKLDEDLRHKMIERVKNRISFTVLFRADPVANPNPREFKFIARSWLPQLVNLSKQGPLAWCCIGPLFIDRWKPIGDVASMSMQNDVLARQLADDALPQQPPRAPDPAKDLEIAIAPRTPRTEFVVLFVWNEGE